MVTNLACFTQYVSEYLGTQGEVGDIISLSTIIKLLIKRRFPTITYLE